MAEDPTDPATLDPGRLRRLRCQRDGYRAALRDAADRLRELRHELRELEGRKAKNEERGAGLPRADADRLVELQEEVTALQAYHDEIQNAHRAHARLVANCEAYLGGSN